MIVAALLAQVAVTPPAQMVEPRDWAATLRADARAFHDTVARDHPGPVNRLDPHFAARNDAALARALGRAARVRDYPGYYWAITAYEASFDDGHVAIAMRGKAPAVTWHWPGFLTGYDGRGRQVVMTRADDAPVPLGAELVGCDGKQADRLAADNLGAFWGRWGLASQRAAAGGRLLMDMGNPFVARPRQCRFVVEGQARTVVLDWRDLAAGPDAYARLAATAPRAHPPIAARTLADGTRWFTLSSFDNDPGGPAVKALSSLIAGMARDRAALVAAPRIVLDLRGNNGGSSDWSRQVAEMLWGGAAIAALPADTTYVEWRASAANLATIEEYRRRWAGSAEISKEAKDWADRSAAGLRGALAAGRPLWREPDEPAAVPVAVSAIAGSVGRVYVLTDRGCGSACLDAVDLWRALGAVQVGQETSADTLYMEVREQPLPSGIATAVVPMKVYRGRRRGANVPWTPAHLFTGDMTDTPALERWIAALPGAG